MQYEEIKNKIVTELRNKKENDKLIEKIALQLKKTGKAETLYLKEKERLENLVIQKNNLANSTATQEEYIKHDNEE